MPWLINAFTTDNGWAIISITVYRQTQRYYAFCLMLNLLWYSFFLSVFVPVQLQIFRRRDGDTGTDGRLLTSTYLTTPPRLSICVVLTHLFNNLGDTWYLIISRWYTFKCGDHMLAPVTQWVKPGAYTACVAIRPRRSGVQIPSYAAVCWIMCTN